MKTMKNKIIIFIIFLFTSNFSSAQDILNYYLEIAEKNNPTLKAKFEQYNASLEKIPQAGSFPDPQISFGYFVLPIETKNGPQQFKLSFNQMFYWMGTLISKKNVFISKSKSKYEEFEENKSKLFFQVKSTFYDLYFNKKTIDVYIENLDILNTLKQLALIKVEVGKTSSVSVLWIDMEINELENNIALLKDQWLVNLVKFRKTLNVDDSFSVHIPNNLWDDDLEYNKQAIMYNLKKDNHTLKSLDLIKESYVHSERLAKKLTKPNFIVGIDYNSIDVGKDAFMVKAGLTIPINRKKNTAMIKEAVIKQNVIELQKENKINDLEKLFEKIYSEYIDAKRRLDLYTKQTKLAKRALELLQNEYANNGRNFEEILRMNRKVLKFSLELEKAKVDKQTSIAFIYYLMGL